MRFSYEHLLWSLLLKISKTYLFLATPVTQVLSYNHYKYLIVIHAKPRKQLNIFLDDEWRLFSHDIIAFISNVLWYHNMQ